MRGGGGMRIKRVRPRIVQLRPITIICFFFRSKTPSRGRLSNFPRHEICFGGQKLVPNNITAVFAVQEFIYTFGNY